MNDDCSPAWGMGQKLPVWHPDLPPVGRVDRERPEWCGLMHGSKLFDGHDGVLYSSVRA
jgi:hypothetical protein